jgi:hypothetical protein
MAFALSLLTLAASGAAGASEAVPRVSLEIPADSQIITSGVVSANGGSWFAFAVGKQLRIYRTQDGRWTLDGSADLPRGFPMLGDPDENLGSTSITGSGVPDFTVLTSGADWASLAIVARIGGRWRVVPFDDQYAPRHGFTFAYAAEDHLIHGSFDARLFAPTTEQWYRFAYGVFVAASPPGEAPACSAKALAAANHWPRPPLAPDPLVRDVAEPFHVVRFACADGWAIATDGHDVALYEQHGPNLNTSTGHDWLRVGVGPPHLVGTTIEYALPRSLLDELGARIGVRFPAAKPEPTPSPQEPSKPWQRAPITVRIGPGDHFSEEDMSGDRPDVLGAAACSRTSDCAVEQFRWRNGRWIALR